MATGVLNLAPKQDQVASYTATQAQAVQPQTVGYKPNEFSVTPQSTVAGQLDSIIKKDSPLLQQARQRARLTADQAMNDRGLLSSSAAVGAATEAADNALYERAIPIAQQDAQTFGTASTNTTNAQNAALYSKMQADNAAFLRGAELTTNVNLANADAQTKADAATAGTANQFKQTDMETNRSLQLADKEYQRAMATATLDANTRLQLASMDNTTRLELANVDRNTRVELSAIENNYRQLLQLNQDAATMYNQVSTNISNISASNLSAAAKNAAIETQLNLLRQGLNAKQAVTGTPATGGTTPAGPTAPNVQALNIGSYFQQDAITDDKPDQAGYDKALAQWQADEAAHLAKYGVPIPTSAYKDGYKPPRRADYGLPPEPVPPAATRPTTGTTPRTTTLAPRTTIPVNRDPSGRVF